jgi:hypothetical protein
MSKLEIISEFISNQKKKLYQHKSNSQELQIYHHEDVRN